MEKLRLIAVNYRELGEKIAQLLEIKCDYPEIIGYPNHCIEVKLPTEVRDCWTFILFTSLPSRILYRQIWETILTINAAHQSFARETVLVMPYFSYARSDKKEGRMGIAASLKIGAFKNAGMTHAMVIDLHAPQVEGFFGPLGRVDHFQVLKLLLEHLQKQDIDQKNTIVLPDDSHALKRAELIGQTLKVAVGSVEKIRISSERVRIKSVKGAIKNKTVIICSDEILTGGTMSSIVRKIEKKAARVIIVATHGLFVGKAVQRLSHPLIKKIIVSDTVPIKRRVSEKLPIEIVSVAPFLASVIKQIYEGKSMSQFFH